MQKSDWNGTVHAGKLLIGGFWTVAAFVLWILWSGATVEQSNVDPELAGTEGLGILITSGCCCGSWLVGLVGIMLIFAFLRR